MALPTTTNVTRPRALGYSFRLDDLYLRGATATDRPLDISTAPLQAERVNTATSSEDIRNEFGEIFSRTGFTAGEGLDFAHQRDLPDNAAVRYWDSSHIDISNVSPGELSKIRLLPATANIETSSDVNLHLAFDGSAVYMAEGTGGNSRRATDYTAATPTFADSATGAATTITDLTTLGTDTYAAAGTAGIKKRTGGVWGNLASAPTTQKVWGLKIFLLAATGATGAVLSQIDTTTGTETAKVTLPTGEQWLDAEDCGLAILACGSDGNVYALANDSAGVLTLQAQTPMPAGEIPYCVGFDGHFVFIGTREATASGAIGRLYRMELATGFVLGNAELQRQWGDQTTTVDQAPRRIVAARKGVVTGIYEPDGAFLWRYDSASAGVSRHLDLGASGLVVDILAAGSVLFATVSAHGLRREQVGTYESNGYLIGPLGDLFTASPKSWGGALLDHDAIVSDERVELYYTTDPSALSDSDSAAWVRVKNVMSGTDTEETPLRSVDSRFLAGMVKLAASSNAATSPAVHSFAFRAYPGPGDVEVTMAVNTSDVVTRPGRRQLRTIGLGATVYGALKNREGRYAELEILATGETFRGVVKQVATRIPTEVERGSASAVTMVTFRGRRVTDEGSTSISEAALGIGALGVMTLGGVE